MRPNLFEISTKELSQDAFFCWLLKWADESNQKYDIELQKCGNEFTKLLLRKKGISNLQICTVEADRQWQNIDIWAKVNDQFLIIIEDKTFTSHHSNQLETYLISAQKWCQENNLTLIPIYLKTGEEPISILREIKEIGYSIIERKEIVNFFKKYDSIQNDIFTDFKDRLFELEKAHQSFRNKSINDWDNYCWQGFYKLLEGNIEVEGWGYVNNPSRSFWGLWWHFLPYNNHQIYLQIEQDKLCIKIGDVLENHSAVRNECYDRLIKKAKELGFNEIKKPKRFGKGVFMTLAIIEQQDWLGTTIFDEHLVISNLRKYEKFISECVH